MTDLEEWEAIEDAARARDDADHNAHVDAYARFTHSVTVQLALRFSELARVDCNTAMIDLDVARLRAEKSVAHLIRTTATLEQAIRLHAMGRR